MSELGGRPWLVRNYSLLGALLGLLPVLPVAAWRVASGGWWGPNWWCEALLLSDAPCVGFLLGGLFGFARTSVSAGWGHVVRFVLMGCVLGAFAGAGMATWVTWVDAATHRARGEAYNSVAAWVALDLLGVFWGALFGATVGILAARRAEDAGQAALGDGTAQDERQPDRPVEEGFAPAAPSEGRSPE